MNYTQNYQLTQWEKADRIVMADFNSDNAKLDAALQAQNTRITTESARLDGRIDTESARLEAMAITAPVLLAQAALSAPAGEIILTVPPAELAKYRRLRLSIYAATTHQSSGSCGLRVNGVTGQQYRYDGGTGTFENSYIPFGATMVVQDGGTCFQAELLPCGPRVFVRSWCVGHNVNNQVYTMTYHGEIGFCSFSALRTITLTGSGYPFAAGTYVYLLGEKY